VNVFSYGVEALLVEVDSPDAAAALRAQLTRSPPPGTTEALPGLRTVLIRFDRRTTDAGALARQLTDLADGAPPADADTGRPDDEAVLVRVSYDGDDLDDVAAHSGLTVDAVIAAHQARAYRVALIGMAPGFYFLSGGDSRLDVPRRPSPRQHVPRGAVGLAGPLTGIYPRQSPGGWQLIGQVLDNLWHSTRLPAALLAPGAAVRFTAAKR
jgi:KipI family sensor histidine kinase inhibitor